jgi:hypothetical protein
VRSYAMLDLVRTLGDVIAGDGAGTFSRILPVGYGNTAS